MRHGIVGAGFGAAVHLPAFRSLPGVEIVALADGGSGRARRHAPEGTRAYDGWQAMLERETLDSLSVVVPPVLQRGVVEAAAERGLHVLCEKPLGASLEEARHLVRAQEGSPGIGAVGFQFRYEPGIAELRRLVVAGRLGTPRRFDVSWLTAGRADPSRPWSWQHDARSGGGVILALLGHVVDLVLWIDGSEIQRVVGSKGILVPERPDAEGRLRAVTAEDRVDVIADLASGAVASLRVSNCQPRGPGMRFEVHGDAGSAVFTHRWPFRPEDARVCLDVEDHRGPIPVAGCTPKMPGDSRVGPFAALAADFVAVASGAPPKGELPGFRDALRVHEVAARL